METGVYRIMGYFESPDSNPFPMEPQWFTLSPGHNAANLMNHNDSTWTIPNPTNPRAYQILSPL